MEDKIIKFDQFTIQNVFDSCMELLQSSRDFTSVKEQYKKALQKLRKIFSSADKLDSLYKKLILLNMQITYEIGIYDNLKHFKNPEAPSFLENYDQSMHESKIKSSADYIKIYSEIEKLTSCMSDTASSLYHVMLEYIAALETYMPKLAHYYGYMYANSSLSKTVSDYTADDELSVRYAVWLSNYLGIKL